MSQLIEARPEDLLPGNALTQSVLDGWSRLLQHQAQPLYIENESTDEIDTGLVVGRSRTMAFEGGALTVSRYTDTAYQSAIGRNLSELWELPMPFQPAGQIEYQKVTNDTSLSGSIYVQSPQTTSQILAHAQIALAHPDEQFGEDTEACYDFARSLGVGALFSKVLFGVVGVPSNQGLTVIRDSDKLELSQTLAALSESEL